MSHTFAFLPADETLPLPLEAWFDELSWNPSQCYCRIQHRGVNYILYLRWRWTDPWQAYIITNVDRLSAMNDGRAAWSGDLFEVHGIRYRDLELQQAKQKLISLFYDLDGNFSQLQLPLLQQHV